VKQKKLLLFIQDTINLINQLSGLRCVSLLNKMLNQKSKYSINKSSEILTLKSNDIAFVSIIVPVRNEIDYINLFIQSLLKQDFCHLKYEIIIADGSSDDGTREVLDRLSV